MRQARLRFLIFGTLLLTRSTEAQTEEPETNSVEHSKVDPARIEGAGLDDETRFAHRRPRREALRQLVSLFRDRDFETALGFAKMLATPQAIWIVEESPRKVRRQVRRLVRRAERRGRVPVLVAYNIPFRDCAQFSDGGATTSEAYARWIDAFASGIGDAEVVILLEPDGLGIIPHNVDLNGIAEWCQPPEANPMTAAAERYAMLTAALDRLLEQPNAHVYLDGTHSRWLGVGDISDRLVRAGVKRAAGFFLNVSNYQDQAQIEKYGSWISACIAFATDTPSEDWRHGRFDFCASQYHPANVDDFDSWSLSDAWYAENMFGLTASVKFVIDTSRNGQGRWVAPAGVPGDPQDWCNPPDRGVGLRPTANTGNALIDAFLWAKVPGESDGECNRWAPPGSPDPVRGRVNPPAGAWFLEAALELVRNANPPF